MPAMATLVPELAADNRQLAAVAQSKVPVLLRGESGTGKELLARAVHELSERRGAFIAVNCGGLPDSLLESELFGHRKGAFSGATEDRPGLVRAADRGTLFLDEIGDLPQGSQATLLRMLQEGEVRSVGAIQPVRVDVRVVSATHRDLDMLVEKGLFRADLLARLDGFRVELPPLRERRADLGHLISRLLARLAPERAGAVTLEPDVARALIAHPFPLNVRELEQALGAALALARNGRIELSFLPERVRRSELTSDPSERVTDAADPSLRAELVRLLELHDGNISAVARAMGKDRTQIRRWIRRFGLARERSAP
jgi:DNA-binding NtrC family response regulator